jgi:PAS domain S-box-containing protein
MSPSSIFIRNWSQFAKIFLFTILILVFAFGWVWFLEIPNMRQDLIRERTHATQNTIQMAVSVLEVYRSRVLKGELSQHEAQSLALRTLQETRYSNNQYFWVHNLSSTMLMHPFNTELVGKNLNDFRDSHGKNIFREMNELILDKSEGVIEYSWPRPGSNDPEEKMSCVRLYEPWGWIIGSGIYLDDVTSDISSIKKRVVTSVITAFMFALLLAFYVIYRINQPLRQTIAFARQVASGQTIASIEINPETEGGKVLAVIKGLMSDLQAAYRRQKSIIETSSDGFFTIDTDGKFKEVNHSFSRMVRYSRDELLSLNLETVEANISTDVVIDQITKVIEKNGACFEKQYRRKDGTLIDVEVSANYTEEDNGCLIFFVRDISERIRLRQEELETAILKNAILEHSPLGIAYIKDRRFQWVNGQLAEMLSVSEGDIVGESFQKFFLDDNEFEKFINDSTKNMSLQEIHVSEMQLTRGDGNCWWCRLSGSRLELNASENGIIWLFEDISADKQLETERKLLEAQLIQAQKMEAIGSLAGGVAHEFNNILQVIGGYTFLLHDKSDFHKHNEYLAAIDTSVKRASRLTQGMLTYSRQQIFSLCKCDIDDTIQQILPFLDGTLGENTQLEIITNPESIYCNIDSVHIQQAVINLVTNARDAIGLKGLIQISTRQIEIVKGIVHKHADFRPGKFAVISVSDTGEGMDEITSARIFDPFFTTKGIGKGTGLGLSIVFGIMSQHNGFVTCDSSPGKGSTFSLYIPLDDSNAPHSSIATTIHSENCCCGGTILLAEDDEEVGNILTRLLEMNGYHVLRASDGNEAVATFMASKTSIDLLLFDVMMPNKNGKEALDEIRSIVPSIPVCFISGYASETLDLDLSQSRIDAFITKPVDHLHLIRTLEKLLAPIDFDGVTTSGANNWVCCNAG